MGVKIREYRVLALINDPNFLTFFQKTLLKAAAIQGPVCVPVSRVMQADLPQSLLSWLWMLPHHAVQLTHPSRRTNPTIPGLIAPEILI